MAPDISVLVPAYNDGRFLSDNLHSLECQTHSDFEVIVADDASDDDTPEIALDWARRDSRFRLSRADKNLGMNPNWNRALSEAKGAFVIKLDADDVMQPNCLRSLRVEFEVEPALRFAACRTLDCDEALNVLGPFLGDQALLLHGMDPEKRHLLTGFEWLRLCFDDIQLWTSDALMFRTSELRALGGWDVRWVAADTDLLLRALAVDLPVVHVPTPGVLYRRRANSISERHRGSVGAALESSLIMLSALRTQAESLRPWGRALRQNWWRHWRQLNLLLGPNPVQDWGEVDALGQHARYREERRRLTPPLGVRAEGCLRFAVWNLRRTVRCQEADSPTPR